jgi:hypothetical protein
MESGLRTDLIIDAIKDWLDNQADEDDVLNLYCDMFPVECGRIETDGFNRCRHTDNEHCIECVFNCNNPLPEDYAKNHFKNIE